MHWKQNLSKTEQSVVICTQTILLLLQKFWKIRTAWAICLLIFCKKNQNFITLLLKTRIVLLSTKVSVFQQDQINYHRKPSQRSYLALYWNKSYKNDYYSSIIMWTHKTVKVNIGLSPNKRFSLLPF